jgi:hypothetical protein
VDLGGGLAGGGRHTEEEQGVVWAVRAVKAGGVREAGRGALATEAGGGRDRGGSSHRRIEGQLTRGPDPV